MGVGPVLRMVPSRTVWFFADKTKAVMKAAAALNRGEVKGIDTHSIGVARWSNIGLAMVLVGSDWLRTISLVCQGDLSSYFLLEVEVDGFFIPGGDSNGYCVHSLDTVHNPGGYSSREVQDEGGGVFDFVVFGSYNVQLEHINVLLELFSGVDVGGGQPSHGFPGSIVVDKGGFEIGLELSKCSEGKGS